ncbi:hypothetical protein C0J52_02440 [Blattella germanica]|nr:hypothetical protein C0J52_02440 [Blattella germanica]
MASRRFRIKAVANVPIRRGKLNNDIERSDTSNLNNEITPIAELRKEITAVNESNEPEPSEDLELNETNQNENSNESTSTSENLQLDAKNDGDELETLTSRSNKTRTLDNSDFVPIKVKDNLSVDTSIAPVLSTNVASKSSIPPGLVRKRMKPAVSIAAVNRRPRELNNSIHDNATPSNISTQKYSGQNSDIEISQNHDKRNDSFSEKPRIMSPSCQKTDKDVSSRDIGAGIPGISQIIPTGTAIRPQDVSSSSTPIVGKGEAPQSLPEPDLPSEGAGGGDSVLSKPVPPLIPILQRSRFAKPAPRIVGGVRAFRTGASGSDNESQKSSNSEAALPQNTEQEQITDNKCDNVSASESDDESRRSISDVSTVTPPMRKLTDTSRARFSKPTPNFIEASARRNSVQGSASESEDESRRCISIASTVTPPSRRHADLRSEEQAEQINKEDLNRESSEKKSTKAKRVASSCMIRMAQARQEFQAKFRNQKPDRSRLTMYDLIFYNPTTNPMKSSDASSVDEPSAVDATDKNVPDEAVEEEEEEEEGEDVAMPVPQVKVGPDGQIILDEKSLVIETTGTKKSREDLANSAVIVDTGTYGNGFYSRKCKKSKEWSKEETLKFYRALNTVGTDFSMMKSIFPKRTREDLKIKFKKEDRMNRYLVEKALQREEEEERKKAQQKLLPKPRKKPKPKPPKKPKGHKKKPKRSFSMGLMDENDRGSSPNKRERNMKKRKFDVESKQEIKRRKVASTSSSDENDLESEIYGLRFNIGVDDPKKEEEEESKSDGCEAEFLAKPPKPTRSGRIPQRRKLLGHEENDTVVKDKEPSKDSDSQPMPLEDLTNIEPGSLVVLATPSPTNPSHQIYKVFMVAPNASLSNSVPLPQSLLQSMPGNFELEENSCSQTESQNNESSELLPVEQGPLHGQLAEFLPVQESLSEEGLMGDFIPVHDVEPLTSQLAELLPLQREQSLPLQQADSQENDSLTMQENEPQSDNMAELVPVQSLDL